MEAHIRLIEYILARLERTGLVYTTALQHIDKRTIVQSVTICDEGKEPTALQKSVEQKERGVLT